MSSEVDTKWFQDQLRQRELSERMVAEMLGTNKFTINRMLHGRRRWTADMVAGFASILGLPLAEISRRAGAAPPRDSQAAVRLVGIADASGAIGGKKSALGTVPRPGDELPKDLEAVRIQAPGQATDGWVAFYEPGRVFDREATNRLAVVELRNKGGKFLGIIRRGYESGRWNLWRLDGEITLENIEVASASPVGWIKS